MSCVTERAIGVKRFSISVRVCNLNHPAEENQYTTKEAERDP
jgi:hypothetical protein